MGNAKHDVDFYEWTQEQAVLLRAIPCEMCPLDLNNLAEEIEDMGRDQIDKISSYLRQTLIHLLKIAVDGNAPAVNHWYAEIINFQGDAALVFSPGLRQRLDMDKIWRLACNGARRSLEQYDVPVPAMPEHSPLSLDDLLDEDFDPKAAVEVMRKALDAVPSRGRRK